MSTGPGRHRRSLLGTTAAAIALLAGCTGSGDQPRDPPRTASASGSPAASSTAPASPGPDAGPDAAPPPAPEVGRCYRLSWDEATAPTSDAAPVPCGQTHTAQTFHVGTLDLVVDGHLLAVDSEHAQRQVARTCQRRLARYVGGDAEERRLSRLHAVWFSPTLAESDQGASWFRCDLVAPAASRSLARLPPPGRLEGILDREEGARRFGLCATSAPGSPGFERVTCSRRHRWRALATIRIAGGSDYPGVRAVRRAGNDTCRDLVRERSVSPERFRYGWEWPTREQWREGRRFGYCWAPG